jgi:mono/diheme cytochrome c family protein
MQGAKMLIGLLLACKTDPKEVPEVAYYGTIDAVMAQNCTRCHTTGGQALSFDKPEDVQALAETMLARVEAGQMPPPAPAPSCRDYLGSGELVMDEEEIALLKEWVETGTPLGDPANAFQSTAAQTIGPFDHEMIAPTPYTPSFRDGENDYRCFRMDLNNPDTTYLTGMEAILDNVAIVHHIVIYNANNTEPDTDPTGFSCSGFGESGWDYLAGWAPGAQPLELPEGMGLPLAANTTLILQMHYFNSFDGADKELDGSGYGIKLADSVETEVVVLSYGTYQFTIPANDADFESSNSETWNRRWDQAQILGIWPHMHLLGDGFDMSLKHEDGNESCLVHMDGWDFHNQISALYLEPAIATAGDEFTLSCHYNNSSSNPNNPNSPPQDVEWGEGTTEEMCFGFTYVAIP